jgi:hypothetical protein
MSPTARIIAFPPRGPFDIVIAREGAAWLVIVRGHGWLHGDRHTAIREARWLAQNLGVAVCEVRQ